MTEENENVSQKRPTFGARYLKEQSLVFQHNTWDNVEWNTEQEEEARRKVEAQAESKMSADLKEEMWIETEAQWDKFYNIHQNRFFKDRHWLFTEFPELTGGCLKSDTPVRVYPGDQNEDHQESSSCTADSRKQTTGKEQQCDSEVEKKNYLEIGCGVGNTVFPILEYNTDPRLFVYCCDFSRNAVDILRSHANYNPNRCHAFVCDVTAEDWKAPFAPASLDIVTLIFVLSAIHPNRMRHVVRQLYHYLKPGGRVLFRDYGRYDMAQLRFKQGQMMEDNFYARKDGTFVYFFTQVSVRDHFKKPSSPDDRYDLLGKSIAYRTKALEKRQRLIVEKRINDIVFEAEMGMLNMHASLYNFDYSSSSSSRTPSPSNATMYDLNPHQARLTVLGNQEEPTHPLATYFNEFSGSF